MQLAVLGCGGPEILPVEGEVIFSDGEPARTGRIEYNSVNADHRAMGVIDETGRFELVTAEGTKGLPAGEYDVIVVQIVITQHMTLEEHDHGRAIPRRYADYTTSGLKAVVSPVNSKQQRVVVESK